MSPRIPDGVIDVHAHWLPRELFGLPPGSPFGAMHDREGQLYLGDTPLSIDASAMSDVPAILGDMARNNIFPGDMLLKNFGVTRHGRVVFYDYDEISFLTEVNFRHIPPPRYPEDEWSAEPWYSVAPNDIFPEEFATFLRSEMDRWRPLVRRLTGAG